MSSSNERGPTGAELLAYGIAVGVLPKDCDLLPYEWSAVFRKQIRAAWALRPEVETKPELALYYPCAAHLGVPSWTVPPDWSPPPKSICPTCHPPSQEELREMTAILPKPGTEALSDYEQAHLYDCTKDDPEVYNLIRRLVRYGVEKDPPDLLSAVEPTKQCFMDGCTQPVVAERMCRQHLEREASRRADAEPTQSHYASVTEAANALVDNIVKSYTDPSPEESP